jgi:hypothetical protein
MIRKIKRFLIIIGVTLSGVFWIACGVQCADAKTGLLRSSPSMKASKEKGVFCFEMTPSQKKYNLTDSVVFKIKSVWVEYQWKTECVNNIPVLKKILLLFIFFMEKLNLPKGPSALSAGPIHFAYVGWAFVDIFPESAPTTNENYFLVYDHPYSFEAESFLNEGITSDRPVCQIDSIPGQIG